MEYLCFLQSFGNKHLMASFDEAGNLAKGDQGQIFSAWICVVMVAIGGSLLILWITVLEKYSEIPYQLFFNGWLGSRDRDILFQLGEMLS
jgi:hypothetical protein